MLIVGDGPQLGAIQSKIAALGITSRVVLAGQRTDPERWMQALDVFCLPSYANEGVPQALLQAMLCGLPIVTTPVGAILEAVTDKVSALVVPPRNATMLAESISRLLDDKMIASQLALAARESAETNFSRRKKFDAGVIFAMSWPKRHVFLHGLRMHACRSKMAESSVIENRGRSLHQRFADRRHLADDTGSARRGWPERMICWQHQSAKKCCVSFLS
jgi:hypothetical protein